MHAPIQHLLSTAMCAMPIDASGVPFNCSHVYASGNAAADMLSNVCAESTGRMLAVQLFKMTGDAGMKDMLRFLIARDTMHQNQWLAAWEELGGRQSHPIPDNFPMSEEHKDMSYAYLTTGKDDSVEAEPGRWNSGPSIDGRGTFRTEPATPAGDVPDLGPASDRAPVQRGQMKGTGGGAAAGR